MQAIYQPDTHVQRSETHKVFSCESFATKFCPIYNKRASWAGVCHEAMDSREVKCIFFQDTENKLLTLPNWFQNE